MAEANEPAGLGFKIFTILGILFFLAVVALLIGSSGTDGDVATVAPAVATPAPASAQQPEIQAPVGAVATGGGGMAGDAAGIAVPAFAGLVALTMLAVSGIVLRRRVA